MLYNIYHIRLYYEYVYISIHIYLYIYIYIIRNKFIYQYIILDYLYRLNDIVYRIFFKMFIHVGIMFILYIRNKFIHYMK